ncbi:MAG: putative Ig domain-containing protein, partial [Deltaproteobacteria bacterium]|nr:putative Ig domain-containing protein [Deltaproteobacteria bacterium]
MTESSIDPRPASLLSALLFTVLSLALWSIPLLAVSQSGELDPNLIVPTDATLDRINFAAASRGTTIRYEGTGESASVSPTTLIDGLPGDQTQFVGLSAASNQSIFLDFGALRTIDLVQLSLYNVDARHSQYRVEGSGDGVTYAVLADRSIGEHRERQRLTFPSASIRYLRIKALGGSPYPYLTLIHEILAVGSATTTPPSEVEIELNPSHAGQSFLVGRKLNLPAGIYEVSYLSGATSAFASDTENSGKTWQAGYQATVLPDASNYTYGSIHPELSLSSSALGAENLLRNDGSYGGRITVRVPVRGDIAFWIRSATPILRCSIRLLVRQVSGSNYTLKERVRDAMVRSVLQEQVSLANWSSWIKDRSCFSCHVVSQGIVGLRESRRKISSLPVSHSLERASLAALLAWQHVTGETAQVPNAPGGYPRSQTAYWVWALSKLASNESAESVFQLSRGLNWLLLSENPTGGWNADHAEGSAAHLHGDGFPSLTHTSEILDSQVSLIEYLRSVPFVSHPTATASSSGVTLGSNITGMLDVGFARKTNVTGIKLVISDSFDAVNGNFVLTEFEAYDGAQKRSFASVLSNASQSGFPVTSAIDGNLAPVLLNGWAYAPNSVRTTPAQALFVLPQPTSVERIRIWQRYGTHELKKFQLFFTTDPTPNLSSTFQSINVVNVGLDSSLQALYLSSLQRTVDLLTSPTWAYQRNIRTAAYSLMALERSRPYAAPSSDARIQARIAEIVAFLHSTQTPSGGWGDSGQITAAPDSFITALALKALLDASNRTIDSSILSATSLLLNSQGASGMWRAPQLLTELAPTTWVQIALPTLFELLVNSSAEGGRIVEDLLAQGQEDASRLVWTPVPRATGYNIYRKIPGGLYSPIVVNYQTSDGSFFDTSVEPGTTYVYLVKWKDGVGTESDASNEASATPYAAECGTVTRAPAIVSPPLARATEGELYQYAVQAKDDDQGDELRFALPEAPTGMSIDTLTGVIRWTPTPAARGATQVTVVVTDLLGHVALQRYRIIVAERFTNSAPYITSSPLTRATAQHRYLYRVAAFDKDPQDSLIYKLDQGPQGMTFEGAALNEKTSKSPNLLWTPAATALGDHLVRIRVLDKSGLTATQSFTITVRANAPPQFLTTPQAQIGTLSLFHYIPTVLDPDGDALSFSLVSAPAGMTVGPTDGVVRWLTPNSPLSVDGISLRAADPFGGVAEQPLNVIVTDNQPPVIRSSPVDEAG